MNTEEENSYEDDFNEMSGDPVSDPLDQEPEQVKEPIVEEVAEEQPRDEKGQFTAEEDVDWKAEAQKWQHRFNSDLGRQNAHQRKIDEQQQRINDLERKASEAVKPDDVSDKEWSTIVEDFPEIAAAMDARINSVSQRYEQQIGQLQQQIIPIEQQNKRQYIAGQFHALEQEHPDWRDVAKSQEFLGWVNDQPSAVKSMFGSNEAADAAYLISSYKRTTSSPNNEMKQRRERQLRQGQTISNQSGRTSRSNGPAEDDFESAFDYYASKG